MKRNPLQKFDFILQEIDQVAADHPELEGKFDPKVEALLNEGAAILRSQIDPVYQEALRDKPELLAEWDALMREFEEVEAENNRPPLDVAQPPRESPPVNPHTSISMSDEELAEKLALI